MRFHVLATPRFPIPTDELATLAEQAGDWQSRHSDEIETNGLLVGGGGFAIVDTKDEASLLRLVAEMPFSPYSETDVTPVVGAPSGWRQLQEIAQTAGVHARA